MSMSMHCVAVKPADDNYRRMLAAYRACEEAGISPPEAVLDFFNGEDPDETGITQDLGSQYRDIHESCTKWRDDGREGFQVDVTKLPPGTRFVRFYCSW